MGKQGVAYKDLRYTVHARDKSSEDVPAGCYEVNDAINHSETVTYGMYVWDREEREVVYRNWGGELTMKWHLEPHFGGDGYRCDGTLDEAIAEVEQRWATRHQRWNIYEQPGGILLAEMQASGSVVFRQELTGKEVTTLMRRYHKTIAELAFVMGITEKRLRAVRSGGLSDRNAVRDWLEAIIGMDPGPLPERYRISRRDEEADCGECGYPLGVGDHAYEHALGAFCCVVCCRAGYQRKMAAETPQYGTT